MKKFSLLMVAAIVAVSAWSSTASAQCGNGGRFFGGNRGGNGCGVFQGGRVFGYSGPTYHSSPTCFSGQCNTGGYIITNPSDSYQKKVMPSPSYTPYEGAPRTPTTEDLLPPKKIQPPNPKQEGFPEASNILYIHGIPHGRLGDGSYASLSDGTYYRLMPSYGSYKK